MARVLLAERVPHTLVLRGDHLSLQAGLSRGWHQLWGKQGRGAAPLLWRWRGEARLSLCPCSGGCLVQTDSSS